MFGVEDVQIWCYFGPIILNYLMQKIANLCLIYTVYIFSKQIK